MNSPSLPAARPETLVRLDASPADKKAAIREAGQLLVAAGCVDPRFAESMLRRESVSNTFLGSGVAIPHAMLEDKGLVRRDGLAVLQIPAGLEWGPGQTARLVVGIAAASDSHIAILRRLTGLLQNEPLLQQICAATDPAVVRAALTGETRSALPAAPLTDLAEATSWVLDYPAGLHARPASLWVAAARKAGLPMRVRHANGLADPRNLVALLQLGAREGDTLTISAEGDNAASVLHAFRAVITGLSAGEKAAALRAAARGAEWAGDEPRRGWNPPGPPPAITGVVACPGLVVGTVHRLDAADLAVPDIPVSLAEGGKLLEAALNKTRQQMIALADDATRKLGADDAAIFAAQAVFLDDADLIALACRNMVEGHGVAWSWKAAVESMSARLSRLGNPALAARAADLRDMGQRVLLQIDPGLDEKRELELSDGPTILVAADLSPSDTAGLDPARVAGLVTALGGPASHTAILARTLNIAAVVAAGEAVFAAKDGDTAIVDGDGGRVWLNPSEEMLQAVAGRMAAMKARHAAEAQERRRPALTTDGWRVEVSANVNRPDQVVVALDQGAEGVGLMRTEFLFLERGETPDEDEQYAAYRDMAAALNDEEGGRPFIVRALDIGGDKQVAHLNLPREENPFLGVRGSRLLLRRSDLLEPQLRALYRAARDGSRLSIMFSMIASVAEVLALRAHCARIRAETGAPEVPLGIMVEIPAAAVMADVLAEYVDFFSIGTNDLTQYALAMDRQNPDLAPQVDSLHPAVLRLIRLTVEGAARRGRWVGVCGGIAGDPFGAALLAGLGVNELSMTPRDIPAVKALLRAHGQTVFADLAERALRLNGADEVRALARELEQGQEAA
ncbi:MAG: phosphoenolpyruvate--protein phosphotransferase [Candidatus Accumulibacter sp.]|jgi:phosphocarrier protein FPr|nr:phosphoenolpyruvate--protein phosphotransferase [Accumulibacter sp.]